MKLSAEFLRTQLLLQVNSQTTYGTTNWEVTDVFTGLNMSRLSWALMLILAKSIRLTISILVN